MAFFANRDPAPFETGVDPTADIIIEIISDGFGVDAAAVTLSVNGSLAWTGDAQQSGFSVVKSAITDGFRYVINPDVPLPASTTIPMFLYAEDLDSPFNILNLSWSFDTGVGSPGRLWALHGSGIRRSEDAGASWSLNTLPIPGRVVEGLWGPTNLSKIYTLVDQNGIYKTNGISWVVEDAYVNTNTYGEIDRPRLSLWCTADDSLVVTTGQGASRELIRARSGGVWGTEYTAIANETLIHVHGRADGSAIFAISNLETGGSQGRLLQRSGGGSWAVVTGGTVGNPSVDIISFIRVQVLSATDVRVMGLKYVGGVVAYAVWKWNGTSFSEEFVVTPAGGVVFRNFWMAEDNSDGWLTSDDTFVTNMYRWSGSAWALANVLALPSTAKMYSVTMDDAGNAWVLGAWDNGSKWDSATWANFEIPSPNTTYTYRDVVWLDQPAVPVVPFNHTAYAGCLWGLNIGSIYRRKHSDLIDQWDRPHSLQRYRALSEIHFLDDETYGAGVGFNFAGTRGGHPVFAVYEDGEWRNIDTSEFVDGGPSWGFENLYVFARDYILIGFTKSSGDNASGLLLWNGVSFQVVHSTFKSHCTGITYAAGLGQFFIGYAFQWDNCFRGTPDGGFVKVPTQLTPVVLYQTTGCQAAPKKGRTIGGDRYFGGTGPWWTYNESLGIMVQGGTMLEGGAYYQNVYATDIGFSGDRFDVAFVQPDAFGGSFHVFRNSSKVLSLPGETVDIACAAHEPTIIVVSGAGNNVATLYESRDNGDTWTAYPQNWVPGQPAWSSAGVALLAGDEDPPVVQNQNPAPAAYARISDNVFFEVFDAKTTINAPLTLIQIDGHGVGFEDVWFEGAALPGWSVTETEIQPNRYSYNVDPAVHFEIGPILVRVVAVDAFGNTVDEIYQYQTSVEPSIIKPSPKPDSVKGPKRGPITFTAFDAHFALSLSGLRVTVNNVTVFDGSIGWTHDDWRGTYFEQDGNNWDCFILPSRAVYFREEQEVTVLVEITNPVGLFAQRVWTFIAADKPFTFEGYRFLLESLRKMDESK